MEVMISGDVAGGGVKTGVRSSVTVRCSPGRSVTSLRAAAETKAARAATFGRHPAVP